MQGFALIYIGNGIEKNVYAGGIAYQVGVDGKSLKH